MIYPLTILILHTSIILNPCHHERKHRAVPERPSKRYGIVFTIPLQMVAPMQIRGFAICLNLIDSFMSKTKSRTLSTSHQDIISVIFLFYENEYTKHDKQNDLFRGLVADYGKLYCLANAELYDLTKETGILGADKFLFLLTHIEAQDKYKAKCSSEKEVLNAALDIARCPREMVKFFHHRIPCDCLKEFYRHLKETTKRTTVFLKCSKIEDRRKVYECSDCKVDMYCSR